MVNRIPGAISIIWMTIMWALMVYALGVLFNRALEADATCNALGWPRFETEGELVYCVRLIDGTEYILTAEEIEEME